MRDCRITLKTSYWISSELRSFPESLRLFFLIFLESTELLYGKLADFDSSIFSVSFFVILRVFLWNYFERLLHSFDQASAPMSSWKSAVLFLTPFWKPFEVLFHFFLKSLLRCLSASILLLFLILSGNLLKLGFASFWESFKLLICSLSGSLRLFFFSLFWNSFEALFRFFLGIF